MNGLLLWHLPLSMTVWAGGMPWFKASTRWRRWDWTFCLHPVRYFYFIPTMLLTHNTIPATSTDVEWAFLHGGLTVSKMCHSLLDESTRAATVLSSWCDFPSTIPVMSIGENL
jgi:hypothetical protein